MKIHRILCGRDIVEKRLVCVGERIGKSANSID